MKRFITQTLSRYFRISIGQPARAKPVSMYRQNVTSKGKKAQLGLKMIPFSKLRHWLPGRTRICTGWQAWR